VGESKREAGELTYPLRTAARLTGLSPELLRAWERRYRVVEPLRTPGGTRRYRAADLERLRLVKAAVDAGNRIGQVARLELAELKAVSEDAEARPAGRLDGILAALDRFDSAEVQRLLSLQLSALGAARFAREIALPLVREIGERWANGQMGIASEHLATGVLRSLLGSALAPTATSLLGPRIVFATYLGVELPVEDLLSAVEGTGAAALALSLVAIPNSQATRTVSALRGGLADAVHLWLGGAGVSDLDLPQAVEHIESLEDFEQRVALLGLESAGAR
jgi:DNA-binding transcriptional MerR regulator